MDGAKGAVARLVNPLPIPTVGEQVYSVLEDERESLYICPNPWALRHRFVSRETGEMLRARCDSWRCLYCGPRKVDQWRQLIAAAEPELFVTLTRVGWTVEEAARTLTTVVQRLRRGSIRADRPPYLLEYFAALERHADFEKNGFHWHLLVKGVPFLPKPHVSDALRSATRKRGKDRASYVVDVKRVRKGTVAGYITKYITKELTEAEKGIRIERREMEVLTVNERGETVIEKQRYEVEKVSQARRIRYSRRFFPTSVDELRMQLFSQIEDGGDITIDEGATPSPMVPEREWEDSGPGEEPPVQAGWMLLEKEPFSNNVQEYRQRKASALHEVLLDRREKGRRLNRRVLGLWDYQRRERKVSDE